MLLKRKHLGQFLQVINSLSLDVALGAIAGSYILLFVAGIPSDGISILALALTVWLIYTLDHLLDAKEISGPAETFRHRIHQIYKIPLWSALILFGFLCIALIVPSLPNQVLLLGSGLSLLVLLHWALSRLENNGRRYYFKEFRISTIYVLGLCIPAISSNFPIGIQFYSVAVMIWVLASINLISISLIEKRSDQKQNMASISTGFSDNHILRLLKFLALFFLASLGLSILYFSQFWMVWGILMLIFLGTITPIIFKKKFLVNESYRILGDWSFSLSFLVFL